MTNQTALGTVPVVSSTVPAENVLRELLHKIRTPLAALVTLGELCEDSSAAAHNAAVEHLSSLVRRADARLRGAEGSLTARPSAVAVGEVLDETVALLQAAHHDACIIIDGATGCRVLADRVALTQILVNLLVNALRYAPAQTDVHVEVTCAGSTVAVAVCDQGPGVDPAVGERVFDSGVSDGHVGGSGLGLFLARQLAQSMRGRLEPGRQDTGGCLVLTLPAA